VEDALPLGVNEDVLATYCVRLYFREHFVESFSGRGLRFAHSRNDEGSEETRY
jgi:hypothetical protein